jgi:hypothetical protein
MQSAAFGRLLARLTGIACVSSKGETRRFRAGLDYTVATYGSMADDARLNTVWCLVDEIDDVEASDDVAGSGGGAAGEGGKGGDKDKEGGEEMENAVWRAADKLGMWAEGEVGGFECYIEAEEDAKAEASDVFRTDADDGPLLQVPKPSSPHTPPKPHTLTTDSQLQILNPTPLPSTDLPPRPSTPPPPPVMGRSLQGATPCPSCYKTKA